MAKKQAEKTAKYKECVKFGKVLRKMREDRGWSQYDLAKESKISRSYLAELETGNRNPTLVSMMKLAKFYKISLSELVDGL